MIRKISLKIMMGFLFWVVFALNSTNGEANSAESVLAIINEAKSGWKDVDRLMVEYEAIPLISEDSEMPLHMIMAVAKPDKFYHMGAHISSSKSWREDPFAQELFICSNEIVHRWTFNRAFEKGILSTNSEIGGSIPKDILLPVLPYIPTLSYKFPALYSKTILLPGDAICSTNYHMVGKREIISNEDCVCFDNLETECIWVCVSKGACIMRRETREQLSRRLLRRITTERIAQVRPSVWLPVSYRVEFFKPNVKSGEDVVVKEISVFVSHYSFNEEIPDDIFIPRQQSGAITYDKIGNFKQVAVGGLDLLDNIANCIGGRPKIAKLRTEWQTSLFLYYSIFGILAGIGLSVYQLFSKK